MAKDFYSEDQGYFSNLKQLLLSPLEFFEGSQPEIEFGKPMLFLLKNYLFGGTILTILALLIGVGISAVTKQVVPLLISLLAGILATLFVMVTRIIGAIIAMAIYHVIMMIFGAEGDIVQGFKAAAYADAPVGLLLPVFFLPLIGYAMVVWVLILRGIALKEYYQTSGGIAAAAVIIPIFLWMLILMMLIVFAFTLGAFA